MQSLRHVLFGTVVGLGAAGLAGLLHLSPTLMFGLGMVYGSLAQLVAAHVLPDDRAAEAEVLTSDAPPAAEFLESHDLASR